MAEINGLKIAVPATPKNIEEVNEWILQQEDKDQYTIETVKGLLIT